MSNEPLTLPDFRQELHELFEADFVVSDFMYHNLCLDYAIIATDRLIEVCYVQTKDDYAREMATIGHAGPRTFKKHPQISAGKFISNAFYFLSPARVLTADEVPKKYGLITHTGSKLTIRKEADFIDPEKYLSKSNYLSIAKYLAKELYKKSV